MLCPICNSHNSASSPVCISCGTPLSDGASLAPLSLAAGTGLQGGAYLIQHVLGQGGFGITYLGHDVRLRRPVAIKEFFPTGCLRQNERVQPSRTIAPTQYETIKHRFLEEARTLAQFHHPGIVDVYTCFEENDTAYMVMEFLHGKTLLHLLEERSEHLNEAEAVGYIEKVAEALQVVHQAGLLHRDLKPDN
ncbi:MAG: protein kinase, partial [Abitibacteriaceae bacterium]|nr:protein kinase [Abditibacteriaceae bacterium]